MDFDDLVGGLWCLAPHATIFQVYRGGNRSTRRKNLDQSQVTDKLHHIMLYRVHLATNSQL
jgi:hypothetical protein